MNILHLPYNISNQPYLFVKGLRQQGINADCLFFKKNKFYQQKGIFDGKNRIPRYFILMKSLGHAIFNYDIFHFHFNTSFFKNNSDLYILKKFKKKVIMQFWGDDIRIYSSTIKLNPFLADLKWSIKKDKDKIKKIERISEFIDAVIVSDGELFSYVKNYFKKIFFLPQISDISIFKFPSPEMKEPVIIHSPTYRGIKGTEKIIEVIKELGKKYKFTFKILENIPNEQILNEVLNADIVIDQILIGTYGIFSIEAMGSGKPVICYINENYRKFYPEELPIISSSIDNLYIQLEKLIKDGKLRYEIGKKGREYFEKYHQIDVVTKKLIKIYEEVMNV
ncbi:MAG TPA: glycosyltransferase [Candidatus Ratteibacteria bacterium]|nr:glycosyltransferase [Candidatus Ratteibacteria bacterium]